MTGKILLIHAFVPDNATEDEKDVLRQRDEISDSLIRLGYEMAVLPVSLDLEKFRSGIEAFSPMKVFNLVESLGGYDRLIFLAPAVMDAMGVPYTGSPTEAIFCTTNKIGAKKKMIDARLPTPSFIDEFGVKYGPASPGLYIVKSSWNHASIGITEDSIISIKNDADKASFQEKFRERFRAEFFAEQYIDGREFNISMLQGDTGPVVLPPAEMIFRDYPSDKLKIVDYRAKWEAGSFEYQNTVHQFDFDEKDLLLIERLREYCLRCWSLFGLKGYARVDFRVDGEGNPWILEINVNPCLSTDAGYVAAAARFGLSYDEVIERILRF